MTYEDRSSGKHFKKNPPELLGLMLKFLLNSC
jgi:hypothetical protein